MGFCNGAPLVLRHLVRRRNISFFGEKPLWRHNIAGQGTQLEAVGWILARGFPALWDAERQGAAYPRRMGRRRGVLIGFGYGVIVGALFRGNGVHSGVADGGYGFAQAFAAGGAGLLIEVLGIAGCAGKGGTQRPPDGVLVSCGWGFGVGGR